MPIPERQSIATESPELEWIVTDDGSRTLRNRTLDETYHSGCGARTECWHVYLKNSGVLERLRLREATSILEYGFGTGLAFLLTAAAAESLHCDMTYVSLENNLLTPAILRDTLTEESCRLRDAETLGERSDINDCVVDIASTLTQQISDLQPDSDAAYQCYELKLGKHSTLVLWLGDATEFGTSDSVWAASERYDVIYFDPFSPATNPQLWTPKIYTHAFRMLRSGGCLTSYCVKGDVRRDLAQTGFEVSRLEGPLGGKREVLRADKRSN